MESCVEVPIKFKEICTTKVYKLNHFTHKVPLVMNPNLWKLVPFANTRQPLICRCILRDLKQYLSMSLSINCGRLEQTTSFDGLRRAAVIRGLLDPICVARVKSRQIDHLQIIRRSERIN